jgi:WD40 repeat protein
LIRDLDTGKVMRVSAGQIASAFWLEAGLLISDHAGNMRLVDPETGKLLYSLNDARTEVTVAQLHPNGQLAIGHENGEIHLWAPASQQLLFILGSGQPITAQVPIATLQWSRDGKRLLTAGRRLVLWDIATRAPLWSHDVTGDDKASAIFSPDEAYVAAAIGTTFSVLDTKTGAGLWFNEEHTQQVHGVQWVRGRAWDNQPTGWSNLMPWSRDDTRLLLLTWSGDGTARLWDWEQQKEIMRMSDAGPITVATVSGDGKYILTGAYTFTASGAAGMVRIWRSWHQDPECLLVTAHARLTRTLSNEQREAFSLAILPVASLPHEVSCS